jgi:hypothetical protein
MRNCLADELLSIAKGEPITPVSKEELAPKQDPCPVVVPDPVQVSLENRLMAFYTNKLEAIAGQYPDGCQEWLQQCNPELCQAICLADKAVDVTWQSVLAGGTTMQDFEQAVRAWYDLELKAIREYGEYEAKEAERRNVPACYACHERHWWVSVHSVRICGTCHPPGAAKMVKEWLNEG